MARKKIFRKPKRRSIHAAMLRVLKPRTIPSAKKYNRKKIKTNKYDPR